MTRLELVLGNGYTVTAKDGALSVTDGKGTVSLPAGIASRALIIEALQMGSSFVERTERSKEAVANEIEQGTGASPSK
jgi:hypothetical protein